MAPRGGQPGNSAEEGLKKIYTDLAQLKLSPDAGIHLGFINALMQGIEKHLQETHQAEAQRAAQMNQMAARMGSMGGPPGGGPGMQMGGPGPGGGGMPPGGPPGPPPAQGSPGIQLPNMGELQRVLQGSGTPG